MKRKELQSIRSIIRNAIKEDVGKGDITVLSTIPERLVVQGKFIAKESGIIAGLEVAHETLKILDPHVSFSAQIKDGNYALKGTVIATVRGKGRALLTAERTALNFLQRMSGIATITHSFVEAVRGTKACILDTRKTAPGLRLIDKWAVRLGGGHNHRLGLFDMALIKENHIAAAGGITKAVGQARKRIKGKKIEVEVRNLNELREALELNIDRILLDNMTLEEMREAVTIAKNRTELEASGNITLDNVAAVAATGVDVISVGNLTHSVQALDISFLIDLQKK